MPAAGFDEDNISEEQMLIIMKSVDKAFERIREDRKKRCFETARRLLELEQGDDIGRETEN